MGLNAMFSFYVHLLLLAVAAACSVNPLDDEDLFSYTSRPDLRPPKLNISIINAAAVIPGYWFVAPHSHSHAHTQASTYQPLQVGPHIYDSNGELVWSGAHLFPRRAAYDFRLGTNGSQLTFIIEADVTADELSGGAYITLGNDYQTQKIFGARSGQGVTNVHEFKQVQGGSLVITSTPRYHLSSPYASDHTGGWIRDCGFQELDEIGVPTFEWWALDHVQTIESHSRRSIESKTDPDRSWDFFHANSIDKTASGNYLLSARDTWTIYLISGTDGRILWRLGGKYSNFTMPMTFSNQHDARVHSENSTTMIISLLDNAASFEDRSSNTSTSSSALLLALDKVNWSATVLRSYPRPDGRFTRIRGNFQALPSGASLAHWSDNNYFSEYSADGEMILEGQLQSRRFESYRMYKFNWSSIAPVEEPAIKAAAYGTTPARATTAIWVSWNGATEVAEWRFYAARDGSEELIASVPRTKFETFAMADGYFERVVAKAVDASGNVLGSSRVVSTDVPSIWNEDDSISGQVFTAEQDVYRGRGREGHYPAFFESHTTSVVVMDSTTWGRALAVPPTWSLLTFAALMVLVTGATLALVQRRRFRARYGTLRKMDCG